MNPEDRAVILRGAGDELKKLQCDRRATDHFFETRAHFLGDAR
jgi:hypothetical protein